MSGSISKLNTAVQLFFKRSHLTTTECDCVKQQDGAADLIPHNDPMSCVGAKMDIYMCV